MDKILKAYEAIFKVMQPYFDERTIRLAAAAAANHIGHGGIKQLAQITRLTEQTISKGIKELEHPRL